MRRFFLFVLVLLAVGCGGEDQGGTSATPSTGSPTSASSPSSTSTGKVALTQGFTAPDSFPTGTALAVTYARQPSVTTWEPNNVTLPTSYVAPTSEPAPTTEIPVTCLSDRMILEKRPGPYSHPLLASDFSGNVFFVDDDAASEGEGTKESPFKTINKALSTATASGKTAAILVAGGEYKEKLTLGPEHSLFGGFNPSTWTRDLSGSPSVIRIAEGSLTILPSDEFATVLDGFTVYGGVQPSLSAAAFSQTIDIQNKARAIVRNNTVYMPMNIVDWTTYGDTHYGTGLQAVGALLQLYHNRFLINSAAPEHTISSAMWISGGCAAIANNHFSAYRTSMFTENTKGAFSGNLIEDGFNGISIFSGNMLIQRNAIGLLEHDSGCGYAIYMSHYGDTLDSEPPTQPRILGNTIILEGHGAQGVTEPYKQADPSALVDNRFILQNADMKANGDYMLYGDFDGPHSPGKIIHAIKTIEEVNALADIPENSGNAVQ